MPVRGLSNAGKGSLPQAGRSGRGGYWRWKPVLGQLNSSRAYRFALHITQANFVELPPSRHKSNSSLTFWPKQLGRPKATTLAPRRPESSRARRTGMAMSANWEGAVLLAFACGLLGPHPRSTNPRHTLPRTIGAARQNPRNMKGGRVSELQYFRAEVCRLVVTRSGGMPHRPERP